MGWCQEGSPLAYDPREMDLRNLLWLAPPAGAPGADGRGRAAGEKEATLWMLDARAGGAVGDRLLPWWVGPAMTVYEGDLGECAPAPIDLGVRV